MNNRNYYKSLYEDKIEKYYVKSRIKNLKGLLGDFKPRNVLEIGIGFNSFSKYFQNFDSWTIIEPNEHFILNSEKEGIFFYNVSFEEFNNPQNITYDLIIISSLLHIINNLDNFLNKLAIFSNQTPMVYVNVPNSNSLHRILAVKMGLLKTLKSFSPADLRYNHARVFNMEDLIEALNQQLKMKIISKGSYFLKFVSNNQLANMLDYKIVTSDYIQALDEVSFFDGDGNYLGAEIFIFFKLSH
jgi:hypothetical protein